MYEVEKMSEICQYLECNSIECARRLNDYHAIIQRSLQNLYQWCSNHQYQ